MEYLVNVRIFFSNILKIIEDRLKTPGYNHRMDSRELFKSNLIKLRKEMKWTQYDLAARTGLSPKQITRLEAGTSFPSSKTLDQLSKAFSVPVTSFFIDPNDPYATIDVSPFYELNKHISTFYVTAIKETADELTLRMQELLKEGKFDRFEFEKLIAPDSLKELLTGIGCRDTSDNFAEKIAQKLAKKLVLDTNRKLSEQEEDAKERKKRKNPSN